MRKFLSILTTVVIVTSALAPVLIPQQTTAASIQSTATKFAGCATGNIAGTYLASQIAGLVSKLKNKVLDALTTVPVSDSTTQANTDTANIQFITKAYVTDVLARCGARAILNLMIDNTYQIMRTAGRDGGATFVKNWVNLQTAAQYRGENIFRAELSTAKLCDYLATDIKKSFGVDPKTKTPITGQNIRTDSLQPFNLSANCTMPAGFTPQKYQQDFAGNGGWNTFSRMLEPQNNAMGLAALSQNEIAKQRTLQQTADQNQALAGKGYIGISGSSKAGSCAVKSPSGADCIVYNDIKTTGSYIADSVATSINAELTWITSAQGLGSIIANATEVLLNRLLDQGSSDEGSYRNANDTTVPTISMPPTPTPVSTPTPPPIGTPVPTGTPYALGAGWDNPMTTATNLVKQALLHGLIQQPAIDFINAQGTGIKAVFMTAGQAYPCTQCIQWYDKSNYAGNFQWIGPDGPYNGWNASWDSNSYVPWDGRPGIFVGPDGKMPTQWRFQPNQ